MRQERQEQGFHFDEQKSEPVDFNIFSHLVQIHQNVSSWVLSEKDSFSLW